MNTDHNYIIYNSELQISSELVMNERRQEKLKTWANHLKEHVDIVKTVTEKLQAKYYRGEYSDKTKFLRTKSYAREQGALLQQIQNRLSQLK
jgi:hypothetical protein